MIVIVTKHINSGDHQNITFTVTQEQLDGLRHRGNAHLINENSISIDSNE